jgi:hypothetical protein
MAFDWGGVDWWGLCGSLALIVPPVRLEVAKLKIFMQQRKAETTPLPAIKTLRHRLIDAMKSTRDEWRFVDSLFFILGGLLLAWSFLRPGFLAP